MIKRVKWFFFTPSICTRSCSYHRSHIKGSNAPHFVKRIFEKLPPSVIQRTQKAEMLNSYSYKTFPTIILKSTNLIILQTR